MTDVLAAQVTAFGAPPQVTTLPVPRRRDGHALVEVDVAALNLLDLLVASGRFYAGAPDLPYVPGLEAVGRVMESDDQDEGTLVWLSGSPTPAPGMLAGIVTAPSQDLLPLPSGVASEDAAAAGLTAITAWAALERTARLQPGEQVVVLGASGGVGQAAVQAARLLGARRVVAVSRDRASLVRATERGADAVVALDLTDTGDVAGATSSLLAALDGPADVVVDPVWGPTAVAALGALGAGGRLVNIGGSAAPSAVLDSAVVRGRSLSILGFLSLALSRADKHDVLRRVLAHVATGDLLVDHEVVPLADLPAAWRRQASSPRRRLLLRP